MLLALVASVAASVLVFCPVTVAASVLCGWVLKWPRAAEIPVATGLCFVEVLVLTVVGGGIQAAPVVPSLTAVLILTLILLAPLGLYWWLLQASDGLRALLLRVWNRYRGVKPRSS